MEYSFLGRSGLSVSRLAFGTATFGGEAVDQAVGRIGEINVEGARRMIGVCRDAGINYLDCADVYSGGEAEMVLGEALGADRQQMIIASKGTMPMGPGRHDSGSSRRHLIAACEDSLRRLRTDWIDLYQLHYPDYLTPIDETLRALDDLVSAGKIRYVGCSNFSGWQIAEAVAVADARSLTAPISHQISYSLVERDVEHEVIPASIAYKAGLIVWGPLAGGFLSGKYQRHEAMPKGARLEALPGYPSVTDWNKGYDIVEVMQTIADDRSRPVAEVAINWLLRKPYIDSVLLGARTEDQLNRNLKALEWTLSQEEVERLDVVSAPFIPYPRRIQTSFNPDRSPALPSYRD